MRQPLAQWFKNQSPRFRFEKPVFPTAGRTLSALGHRRLNHNFVASGGFVRGRSSIGRARALQARGCRFEPDRLHCFCWCKTVLGCANPLYFNGLRRFLIHYPRFANCAPLCPVVPLRAWSCRIHGRLLGGDSFLDRRRSRSVPVASSAARLSSCSAGGDGRASMAETRSVSSRCA